MTGEYSMERDEPETLTANAEVSPVARTLAQIMEREVAIDELKRQLNEFRQSFMTGEMSWELYEDKEAAIRIRLMIFSQSLHNLNSKLERFARRDKRRKKLHAAARFLFGDRYGLGN